MASLNGVAFPEVSQTELEHRGTHYPAREQVANRLKKFFRSEAFQEYCNLEINNISEGKIIRLVCDNGYIIMTGTNGTLNLAENFDYAIVPDNYDYFLYKSNKVMKKGLGERQIGFSQSYLVRKDGTGKWIVEILLKNGKETKQEAVKTAFDEICLSRSYRSSQPPTIFKITRHDMETYAWVSVVSTSSGGGRVLCCLIDNGELLDLSTQEIEIKATDANRIETKYNRFSWNGEELIP